MGRARHRLAIGSPGKPASHTENITSPRNSGATDVPHKYLLSRTSDRAHEYLVYVPSVMIHSIAYLGVSVVYVGLLFSEDCRSSLSETGNVGSWVYRTGVEAMRLVSHPWMKAYTYIFWSIPQNMNRRTRIYRCIRIWVGGTIVFCFSTHENYSWISEFDCDVEETFFTHSKTNSTIHVEFAYNHDFSYWK